MPREYAQIRPAMWLDDEWRDLTPQAQHLYMLLLSDPGLSHAGVASFKPLALAQRAKEWDSIQVMQAAVELSYAFFCVFDQATEEVMIHSYLRHDGLLKNPRMAVARALAWGTIGSNKIRAAVVFELTRLKKENPDWGAWVKPQVQTVLRQRAENSKLYEVDLEPILGMGLPIGLGSALESRTDIPTLPFTHAAQQHLAPTTSTSPFSNENAVAKEAVK